VKLIASGRASEIFDLEDGRVLRRFKAGGDPVREARAMRHAANSGYPVPQVLEVLGDALVLERIDGPTMVEDVKRRPWRLRQHASLLAELHKRLHQIVAPTNLPEASGGDRLLHLDLHPNNVILSPRGPVVLDWTNARRGDPALDIALTWIIAATSGGLLGRIFVRAFLAHFERAELLQALPAAAEWRLADPNVTDGERVEVRRLVEREAGN
jgi:aminoglycoside phosphotransferase (APT) family kinase protein